MGVLAAAVGAVVAEADGGPDGSSGVVPGAAAVDIPGVHLLVAAEVARAALLLLQRWAARAQRAAAPSGGGQEAAAQLGALVLDLAADWLAAAAQVQEAAAGSSAEASAAAQGLTANLLSAALVALALAPASAGAASMGGLAALAAAATPPPPPQQQRLQTAAQRLLPLLLVACEPLGAPPALLQPQQQQQPSGGHQQQQQQQQELALAASLVTTLIERVVPVDAWLPLLRAHLSLGALLATVLQRLVAARQQQQQPFGVAPPLPALSRTPAVGVALPPVGPVPGPKCAASAEEAVLLLALQVAQVSPLDLHFPSPLLWVHLFQGLLIPDQTERGQGRERKALCCGNTPYNSPRPQPSRRQCTSSRRGRQALALAPPHRPVCGPKPKPCARPPEGAPPCCRRLTARTCWSARGWCRRC